MLAALPERKPRDDAAVIEDAEAGTQNRVEEECPAEPDEEADREKRERPSPPKTRA